MGRAPCCEKVGLKRGPWTPEEDEKLIDFINQHGHGSWRALPKKAGLLRCGKSCRLRWTNYLRPDIKRGKFSLSEEQTIIQLHALLGNRWSTIASHLPKRTDNEIKNYWNTHLKKRLMKMGIDPATHKPKMEATACLLDVTASGNSSISHMAQWESARLEAEARLARESKMRAKGLWPPCNEVLSPNSSSSVSSLKPQASDLSSKPDTTSCNARSALELISSLQNWDESLQGQAKMMWPETWNSTIANGPDSSCCSSPHTDRLEQGSPTSTLCSLEAYSQPGSQLDTSPALQKQRLSWTEQFDAKELSSVALECQTYPRLGSGRFPEHSYIPQVGDIFQNACAELNCSLNGGTFSSQSFQNLMFGEESGIMSPSHSTSPWSKNSSHDDLSNDSHKRASDGVPALTSATTSSSLLDHLDFTSEDITSSKRSAFSSVGFGEISGDLTEDMPSQLHESACESGRQNSFSALLTEDLPDCWSTMLKQFDDSSM